MNDLLQVSVVVKHGGQLRPVAASLLLKLVVDDWSGEGIEVLVWNQVLHTQYGILQRAMYQYGGK